MSYTDPKTAMDNIERAIMLAYSGVEHLEEETFGITDDYESFSKYSPEIKHLLKEILEYSYEVQHRLDEHLTAVNDVIEHHEEYTHPELDDSIKV